MEIDQFLHNFFSDVNVVTETANEGKVIEEGLLLLGDMTVLFVTVVLSGHLIKAEDLLPDLVKPLFVGNHIVFVDLFKRYATFLVFREIPLRERREKLLDIRDGKDGLQIVDQDDKEHVVPGILLLYRRWDQTVLGVIINHGLRHNLIVRITL